MVLSISVAFLVTLLYFYLRKTKPPIIPDAVFLIVVDTLRADRLSCYGYQINLTPNIDSLAAKGVMFKNAYSPASWTRPAMGSIMTSQYPTQLGLVELQEKTGKVFKTREKRKQVSYSLVPYKQSLSEILTAAGFISAAFVNQPALSCKSGFERYFSEFYYPVDTDKIIGMKEKEKNNSAQVWGSTKDALVNDRALANKFHQWLEIVRPVLGNGEHKKKKNICMVAFTNASSPLFTSCKVCT